MNDLPRVRVTFRKQLADGNYGTEAAEVSLEHIVEPGEDGNEIAALLLTQARHLCQDELRQSPSMAIRRATTPPPSLRAQEFVN